MIDNWIAIKLTLLYLAINKWLNWLSRDFFSCSQNYYHTDSLNHCCFIILAPIPVMELKDAFLHGDLNEKIYMQIPSGLSSFSSGCQTVAAVSLWVEISPSSIIWEVLCYPAEAFFCLQCLQHLCFFKRLLQVLSSYWFIWMISSLSLAQTVMIGQFLEVFQCLLP